MSKQFLDLIDSQTLLADGAMGTMLHARGIGFDKCFDELNIMNPSAVAEIHREYIEAGAQLFSSFFSSGAAFEPMSNPLMSSSFLPITQIGAPTAT
jgi:homocysteine S-methyltransferase